MRESLRFHRLFRALFLAPKASFAFCYPIEAFRTLVQLGHAGCARTPLTIFTLAKHPSDPASD